MHKHTRAGLLGTFFTLSHRTAQNFTKKKWEIRNSKYKENANIRPCFIKLKKPHIIHPIEAAIMNVAALHPSQDDIFRGYRYRLLNFYGHDGVVIKAEHPNEVWTAGSDRTLSGVYSEYHKAQIILFDPSPENILSIADLDVIDDIVNST